MNLRPAALLVGALVAGSALLGPAAALGTNDPLFAQQWGLAQTNAPQAWSTSTGRGVTIGVVDTGVDLLHEDLAAKVTASTNCIGSNGDPSACHGNGQDDYGHGTHVSGIAAAVTGNAKGIAGMAPDARLLVAKALDSNGAGSTADINAGIHWVVDHGARVVNLSLGDPNFVFTSVLGSSLQDGIEYAWSKGAIAVLASGNTNQFGLGSSNYGSLDAVVVGAVGRDDHLAGYSSPTGDAKWALLAPGGSNDGVTGDDVLSTYWVSGKSNSYAYLAGTSMATPHVAGALALLLAAGLSPGAAVNRLLATVNHSVSCGAGSTNCHGRLDAAAAVAGLSAQGPAPATATPGAGSTGSPAASSAPPVIARAVVPPPAAPTRPSPGSATSNGFPSTSAPTVTPGTNLAPAARLADPRSGLSAAGSRPAGSRRKLGPWPWIAALALVGAASGFGGLAAARRSAA